MPLRREPGRGDVAKLLAVHRDLEAEEFWRRVEEAVGDLVTTTWSSTFALVEISAAGVTKATTLATLAAEMGLGPDDVIAFAKERLANFKVPRQVEFLDVLPRNLGGKVLKTQLRDA